MTTSTTATTNTTHTAEFMLDQLQVVKLTIRLWTSSKKLRPEDLKLADGTVLPPDTLASLGTKKTIDPKQLLEFTRIKKEAERICLEAGTRFIGGFANPSEEIPRIVNELDALSRLFDQEKQRFLNVYSESTEHWINQHPDFADAIRNAIEPAASVARKLVFDYMVFRVSKPQGELGDSLNRHTLSLSDQLFREIAQDAKELIDRSFVGKDSVTGRVLNAFRRMRDKLDSLGFLDYRCFPIVDEIDRVLASIPKSGPYNGSAYHALFALGLLLSDPDKVKAHGGGLSQTQASWPDDVGQPSAFESVMPEDDEQAMAWPNETTLFTLDDYNAIQYVEDDDEDDDVGNPRLPPHFNRTALSEWDATQAIVFTGAVQQPTTDVADAKTDGNVVKTQIPVPAINSTNDMWF
ncbi:DUF3150 domain-containing protein [Methylovulum psychrotolerans]|uniref:DUF3150 domain-containing protein n=1 Tax=Methylovulum psychrotolerans TaxID=1704499 RepID=A0A2S5CII3_9GAMM|nr:DUF3150 domain-containing protein [Methylovulum psychrotolerans]POZ50623.1 hypothetical protein AADEFJLK_03516 [Methylovulum psychrotolerans]